MNRTFKALAVGVALLAAVGGCRSLTGRSAGEIFDDKTIVGTVKTKLVRDRLQNLTWVDVDSRNGVVYLTGNAESAAQKARATELAEETRGVRRVVNDIVVAETAKADAPRAQTRTAPAASASSTARSSATAPAASPATNASRAATGSISGDVVTVDQGTGDVTLRMAGGDDVQLRLPPSAVQNVKPGDRLSISVNAVGR